MKWADFDNPMGSIDVDTAAWEEQARRRRLATMKVKSHLRYARDLMKRPEDLTAGQMATIRRTLAEALAHLDIDR